MQAIAEVESRVAVVESTLSDIQNGSQSEKREIIGTLTENVDGLQRLNSAPFQSDMFLPKSK